MKRFYLLILCLSLVISLTGCVKCVKTSTYQVEREDQALVGNRGYIMGEIPAPEPDRRRTRTMLGIDVELPSSEEYEARKKELSQEGLVRKELVPEKRAGEAVVYIQQGEEEAEEEEDYK